MSQGSQLAPLEPVLRRLLAEWPQIKAPRLSEILRADCGYTGSLRLVQERATRVAAAAGAAGGADRLPAGAGAAARLGGDADPTDACRSCAARVRAGRVAALLGRADGFFSFDLTVESFLEGHVRALEWLGGVPRECVYDNLRSVVARREHDQIVWSPRFLHLRGHHGFHATACTPATPREKGSVEAAVRYLKSGFWPGEALPDAR